MTPRFELIVPSRKTPVGKEAFFDRKIPRGQHDLKVSAPSFVVDNDLAIAINVALTTGQPLLLTGEPGTGKTQLAYYLAWTFGTPDARPHVLAVKSTTTSRDLLYSFDTVAYFRTKPEDIHNKETQFLTRGPLWNAFDDLNRGESAVVLIDEIDKAPRDFPNDLLFELDQYSFSVPELNRTIERQHQDHPPPFVVITSNSERRLPEPFLRRCIFHHIVFHEDIVRSAVENRRKDYDHIDPSMIDDAIRHLLQLRDNKQIKKPPATAEFLAWLRALDTSRTPAHKLADSVPLRELPFLNALLKDRDDFKVLG